MILEFESSKISKLFLTFENEYYLKAFYSTLYKRFKKLKKEEIEFTMSLFIDKMLPTSELGLSVSPFIDKEDNLVIAKLNFSDSCYEFIDIPVMTDYFRYSIGGLILDFKVSKIFPLFSFKEHIIPTKEYNFTHCGEVLNMILTPML